MGYKYKVKIEYGHKEVEWVGTNNIFYARWLIETETKAGHSCTFYEYNGEAYIEKII